MKVNENTNEQFTKSRENGIDGVGMRDMMAY